jgi:hypothetical protein
LTIQECILWKNGCINSLKKLGILTIVPLMLLSAIFVVPINAHGGLVGQVSINGGTEFSVPSSQTTLSVPVQISGSDALNGFDIAVSANPSILYPTSIDLTGSIILPINPVAIECVNGVLVAGNSCTSQDGIGVVHLAVIHNGQLLSAPVGGLLFTINYNIVGATTGSPISFTTGCSTSSIGNTDCVTMTNGSNTPVSETDLGATFANLVDFTMTPAFISLSTASGVPINDVINFVAFGGYGDFLTDTVTTTSGLTASLASGGFVDLNSTSTNSDTLTVSGTTSGTVTVTATGAGICPCGVITHSTTIPVLIASPGFSVSLSQPSVKVSRGNSDSTTTIKLQGFSGFSGTVSFTASSVSGITGSAPSATLTPDGSGYSTASSALTVMVSSSVTTGNYTLTVTGTSGTATASASMIVMVPGQDFGFSAVPPSITIVRGGSVVATLTLKSLGNFAGTVNLAVTSTVNINKDSCCLTNNTIPGFSTATPSLTAGGSVEVAFFDATVGGTAPPSTYTATGNYTVTITATSGLISHNVTLLVNIQDFTLGPAYCVGSNFVTTTPDGNLYPANTGTLCNSLTITDQFNPVFPYSDALSEASTGQFLLVQTNVLSGLSTNGYNGSPAIASVNAALPFFGINVPELAGVYGQDGLYCLVPTFWPNGTQIPYSYLAAHGPIIAPGQGLYEFLGLGGVYGHWGCKYDGATWPNDQGIPLLNAALHTHFPLFNNPDFFAVTAQALSTTLPGNYGFEMCAQLGVLLHCNMYHLNVVAAPALHQIVYSKTVSVKSGVESFKTGITNNDSTNTLYVTFTITAVGSTGDTLTASASAKIAPNSSANNIALSFSLTGLTGTLPETFSFSISMSVGTDPVNLDGTSTLSTGPFSHAHFTVTP